MVPSSTAPANDDALDDLIHDLVAGCTGLDPTLVRPRWQPSPPPMPEPSVNWCAFGVQDVDTTGQPAFVHVPTGDGTDQEIRYETIEYVFSFYGPNGLGNAALLRDMVAVPQNNEALGAAGIAFLSDASIVPAPALINQQWLRKYDLRLTFARQVNRTLPVLNLLSAQVEILADDGVTQSFNTGS